jgi:hypothetical protein
VLASRSYSQAPGSAQTAPYRRRHRTVGWPQRFPGRTSEERRTSKHCWARVCVQPGETVKKDDIGLATAGIAALAALLGTAVGGVATYCGNRELEEDRARDAARAAARVYEAEFKVAEDRMVELIRTERYNPKEDAPSLRLSLEDKKLIAQHVVSRSQLLAVTTADARLAAFARVEKRFQGELAPGSPLPTALRRIVKETRRAAGAGAEALAPLVQSD